jgi:hypothetical protein
MMVMAKWRAALMLAVRIVTGAGGGGMPLLEECSWVLLGYCASE